MELALITAKQVAELFILIFAGILLYRRHVVSGEHKSMLAGLLIQFVVPCMVIDSFMGKSTQNIRELGLAFLYSLLLCVLGILITLLISFAVKRELRDVYRFACSFSNAAYMGFPLISALFGDTGIMYASAYVTVFNILLWTVGYMFFANAGSFKEVCLAVVKCPPIISVAIGLALYFSGITIPDILAQPIGMAGDMNTPLSMLITGMTVAQTDIRQIVKNGYLWLALLVRLILIPCVCAFVFAALHISGMTAMVCLILEACPAAAITTMLAVEYGKDHEYAAGVVVVSTLLSIITLPLYALLLQAVL